MAVLYLLPIQLLPYRTFKVSSMGIHIQNIHENLNRIFVELIRPQMLLNTLFIVSNSLRFIPFSLSHSAFILPYPPLYKSFLRSFIALPCSLWDFLFISLLILLFISFSLSFALSRSFSLSLFISLSPVHRFCLSCPLS